MPRGTVHGFSFGHGGGLMLEIAGTGAHAAPFFTAIHDKIPAGAPDIPKLLELAQQHAQGRVLSLLEGGYEIGRAHV